MSLNKHCVKNFKTSSSELLELYANLYLLACGYRNMFQIMIGNEALKKVITISKKHKQVNYKIYDNRLIIYDDTFDISKLDVEFGVKFAKQLGKFYTCATANFKTHPYNISISVANHVTGCQIYAQMCKDLLIKRKVYDAFEEIEHLFKGTELHVSLDVRKYK